jgi:hypothetical protein
VEVSRGGVGLIGADWIRSSCGMRNGSVLCLMFGSGT